MLFNSFGFLFVFLPATLLGFALLGHRFGQKATMVWLVGASLVFYGWWSLRDLALIVVSVGVNFWLARHIAEASVPATRRRLLAAGVTLNLLAIAYFKYAEFLTEPLFPVGDGLGEIVLPLAISFFTFQQIAYLVDVHRQPERVERSPLRYALFVTFFPQLIAGPIVHHAQVMPQFRAAAFGRLRGTQIAEGLSWFAVGLFKKVALADPLGSTSDVVFAEAAAGAEPTLVTAWLGALCYTFQLYFDFSGYSDMALGLGRVFGLRLPRNFDSPYKAVDIVDFWRRWHISLSNFLRDYLYIPLGGNRLGAARRRANLMITMLLGGLWHGAGWTFVWWGGLHGFYLLLNHGWRAWRERRGWTAEPRTRWGAAASRGLCFLLVVVAWVFFRAPSFAAARVLLEGMAGRHGMALPPSYVDALGGLGEPFATALAWLAVDSLVLPLGAPPVEVVGGVVVAAVIAFFLPNTLDIFERRPRACVTEPDAQPVSHRWFHWRTSARWAVTIGLVSAWALASLADRAEFLYFNF